MAAKKARLRSAYRDEVWSFAERSDDGHSEALVAVCLLLQHYEDLAAAVAKANHSQRERLGRRDYISEPDCPEELFDLRDELEHLIWARMVSERSTRMAVRRLAPWRAIDLVKQYRTGKFKPSEIASLNDLPVDLVQSVLLRYSGLQV